VVDNLFQTDLAKIQITHFWLFPMMRGHGSYVTRYAP
jgi:hypothetical protein